MAKKKYDFSIRISNHGKVMQLNSFNFSELHNEFFMYYDKACRRKHKYFKETIYLVYNDNEAIILEKTPTDCDIHERDMLY